jgi:hypothetical protein
MDNTVLDRETSATQQSDAIFGTGEQEEAEDLLSWLSRDHRIDSGPLTDRRFIL